MVEVYSLLLMAQNFKEYDLYTPILLLLFFFYLHLVTKIYILMHFLNETKFKDVKRGLIRVKGENCRLHHIRILHIYLLNMLCCNIIHTHMNYIDCLIFVCYYQIFLYLTHCREKL